MRCNLDDVPFTRKPTDSEVGGIINRTKAPGRAQSISILNLYKRIIQGYTFSRAAMKGRSAEDFVSQQLLVADIDNDTNEDIFHPSKVEELLQMNGLELCFIYNTFSSTEGKPKFRVVVVLDTPITDPATAATVNENFAAIFPGTDKACRNLDRIFYGSSKALNPDPIFPGNVSKLPPTLLQPKEKPRPPAPPPLKTATTPTIYADNFDLTAALDEFDILEWLKNQGGYTLKKKGNGYTVNPCPICGHEDDFHVSDDRRHLFTCHGASGLAGHGGNMIHFLIYSLKMTRQRATVYFKEGILGIKKADANYGAGSSIKKAEAEVLELYKSIDQIEELPVTWLLYPYIPEGMTTMISGQSGLGKSFFVLRLAVSVTTGDFSGFIHHKLLKQTDDWKNYQEQYESRRVIYLSSEDSPSRTIRKRFREMGGYMSLFHVETFTSKKKTRHIVGINGEVEEKLLYNIVQLKPRLVVIDPLLSYVPPKINLSQQNQVRDAIDRLGAVAEEHNVAVVFVNHVNRNEQASAINRTSGSASFGQYVRSNLQIGVDPMNKDVKVLTVTKANLIPAHHYKSTCFEIDPNGCVQFLDGRDDFTSDDTIGSIFNKSGGKGEKRKTKEEEGADFIVTYLTNSGGKVPSNELKVAMGEGNKFSPATIQRAHTYLGASIRLYRDFRPGETIGTKIGWTELVGFEPEKPPRSDKEKFGGVLPFGEDSDRPSEPSTEAVS